MHIQITAAAHRTPRQTDAWHLCVLALLACLAVTACNAAHAAPVAGKGAGAMIYWLTPPVGPLHRRSDAEEKRGMQVGRSLPEREFLQPPLDKQLRTFTPHLSSNVRASFTGGASDILPGLVNAWISAFDHYYPNVHITIATPYAGSLGMLQVIKGNYDFVFVSRELKPTDITSFHAKYGYDPLSIPVSGATWRHYGFLDAIGFFVNVKNPLNGLTLQQIDAMYSNTRYRGGAPIRTWGDLGLSGQWADKPIHLYGIKPWNGFEEFVRERVLNRGGKRGQWRNDIHFEKLAFPIAKLVAADPLGIGYTGLAYLTRGVKVLPLSANNKAYLSPTYENVAKATYPLSRLIYFNVNKAPGRRLNPVLDEFVRFILSAEGQQIVLNQGIYLPLRHWQAASSLNMLE